VKPVPGYKQTCHVNIHANVFQISLVCGLYFYTSSILQCQRIKSSTISLKDCHQVREKMSTSCFVPECTWKSYSWRAWDKSFVLQVPRANGSAVRAVAHCRRRCKTPARRATIKRATSRVFCYFRSILCENHYLLPLLIHKMLLWNYKEDMKWI